MLLLTSMHNLFSVNAPSSSSMQYTLTIKYALVGGGIHTATDGLNDKDCSIRVTDCSIRVS